MKHQCLRGYVTPHLVIVARAVVHLTSARVTTIWCTERLKAITVTGLDDGLRESGPWARFRLAAGERGLWVYSASGALVVGDRMVAIRVEPALGRPIKLILSSDSYAPAGSG